MSVAVISLDTAPSDATPSVGPLGSSAARRHVLPTATVSHISAASEYAAGPPVASDPNMCLVNVASWIYTRVFLLAFPCLYDERVAMLIVAQRTVWSASRTGKAISVEETSTDGSKELLRIVADSLATEWSSMMGVNMTIILCVAMSKIVSCDPDFPSVVFPLQSFNYIRPPSPRALWSARSYFSPS